jgi:hypothetical protein
VGLHRAKQAVAVVVSHRTSKSRSGREGRANVIPRSRLPALTFLANRGGA